MYRDCDHLVDENHVFTVRGNWRDDARLVLVKPVYERSGTTNEFNKIVDRCGADGENLMWLDPKTYRHISCKGLDADEFIGNDIWSRMVKCLLELGLKPADIGVFGSKRLGFRHYKDVDFVIYGYENMLLLKNNIDRFKKDCRLYNQTCEHARYQARTHGKILNADKNNLMMCLLRKWSTCSLNENLTTTLRFVDDSIENGSELVKYFYDRKYDNTKFVGAVSGADGASFMPRRFFLTNSIETVEVITPLWIFHQCVCENDLIEVTGARVGNKILVRGYEHGIKHL